MASRTLNLSKQLPVLEADYVYSTVDKLFNLLGANLYGLYLVGSACYDAYQVDSSDLDIQMVTHRSLTLDEKEEIVNALAHTVHPCPANKLEFVSYCKDNLHCVNGIAYDLNVNTGKDIQHVSYINGEDAPHWFVLDMAMSRLSAINLIGPSASEVFPVIDKIAIAHNLIDCIRWFANNYCKSDAHIQCLDRCYVYAYSQKLVSKSVAARVIEETTELSAGKSAKISGGVLQYHEHVLCALNKCLD